MSVMSLSILNKIFLMLITNRVKSGENINRLNINETEKKNKAIPTQTRLARISETKLENRIHNLKSARLIRDPL